SVLVALRCRPPVALPYSCSLRVRHGLTAINWRTLVRQESSWGRVPGSNAVARLNVWTSPRTTFAVIRSRQLILIDRCGWLCWFADQTERSPQPEFRVISLLLQTRYLDLSAKIGRAHV